MSYPITHYSVRSVICWHEASRARTPAKAIVGNGCRRRSCACDPCELLNALLKAMPDTTLYGIMEIGCQERVKVNVIKRPDHVILTLPSARLEDGPRD